MTKKPLKNGLKELKMWVVYVYHVGAGGKKTLTNRREFATEAAAVRYAEGKKQNGPACTTEIKRE